MLVLIYEKVFVLFIIDFLSKTYKLYNLKDIKFFSKKSKCYFCNNYLTFSIDMPKYFFYKINLILNQISFIFLNKFDFINFIKLFFVNYNRFSKLYCIKFSIKGLGYRIRKITNDLYYFFFNYTNMYYINISNDILIKWYKKRILILGNNKNLVKLFFINIFLLKKIGPYRLMGFRYPKQIIYLRKKMKKA